MLPIRWTLHVENFGRIKSADIKIAPMMIFVGQNNTGKSYLASLLWGILSLSEKIFPYIPSAESYEKCRELFIAHYEKKQSELDKELVKSVVFCFNEFLKEKKDKFVKEIFTSNDFELSDLLLKIKEEDIFSDRCKGILETIGGWQEYYEELNNNDKEKVIYNSIQMLTEMLLFERLIYPLYLPASRTGFLLSYKTLISNLMETWGLDKKAKSDFPKPIIHFLQKLMEADISIPKNKYYDIANSLEKEILEGRIEQATKLTVGFYYKPELSEKSLPFHLTSSLITELASLIIFLKGIKAFRGIIFEEPESHLHLNAQRILAKYLVKLVNNDMPVWMTTHSDIFFQQINNLMKTNEERIRKLRELSYQDDEMIAPNDINAYQFNINKDGMTEVVELEKTEDGFIVPTFNQAVMGLSQETIKLETESEDAERDF